MFNEIEKTKHLLLYNTCITQLIIDILSRNNKAYYDVIICLSKHYQI